MHTPLSRKQAHEYWTNPPATNVPKRYIGRPGFKAVVRLVEKHVRKEARILELGCNVGTTLDALRTAGYGNLTGIEINPAAVALLRQLYGDMAAETTILTGPIEERIRELGEYDLIFSKAVLCHLHPDSEWVLAEVAARAACIITVEDEQTASSGRHFPRNYRRVFSAFGFRQVEFVHEPSGMNAPYVGRVLTR